MPRGFSKRKKRIRNHKPQYIKLDISGTMRAGASAIASNVRHIAYATGGVFNQLFQSIR